MRGGSWLFFLVRLVAGFGFDDSCPRCGCDQLRGYVIWESFLRKCGILDCFCCWWQDCEEFEIQSNWFLGLACCVGLNRSWLVLDLQPSNMAVYYQVLGSFVSWSLILGVLELTFVNI